MPAIPYLTDKPQIHESVFLAPSAWVTGKVSLAKNVSVFFGAVLRGDIQRVLVGQGTNIQEGALLHTSNQQPDCLVGEFVTIGHHAIVHGCKIGAHTLIGMGATILDGADIGPYCLVGANSLVTMNSKIPEGSLVIGSPAKVVRQLTADERKELERSAEHYIEVSANYRRYFSSHPH